MSKIGRYLQEHVSGEIITAPDVRQYFATDASIFTLTPTLVLYPRNENDVRKTARFTWQLAERGRTIPITARGSGTDQGGAAIGSGIMMVFPAHMNRIMEFDSKSGVVTVEPGINYGKLQQALHTHGRFLPPYPASLEYSTIGGAVANNAGGVKSIKYGDTRAYVKRLRVVLANGEVIITERLSKRELNKKMGLATFEGEIYRSVDALLEENKTITDQMKRTITKNAAGYDLSDVKHRDGSFDLTPLFVGSQGTLGILTEMDLETEEHNPETTLYVASFESAAKLQAAVLELKKLRDLPSAVEIVDGKLLAIVSAINPGLLRGLVDQHQPLAPYILLVEFDELRGQKRTAKKGSRILERYSTHVQMTTKFAEQEQLWKLRQLPGVIKAHAEGQAKAVPLIEDGVVPAEKLESFILGIYELLAQNQLSAAVWGHAGDAHLHVQPYLDLSQLGDRQKAFRLLEQYTSLVTKLGGTLTGENGDGRLRAPYYGKVYGPDAAALAQKIKQIFDPYGLLNPGVKVGTSVEDLKALLRQDYSFGHIYEYLPRS